MVAPIKSIVSMDIMDKLFEKLKGLQKEANNVQSAIDSLQNLCEHDYEEDCCGSHKTHYICKNCGHKTSW